MKPIRAATGKDKLSDRSLYVVRMGYSVYYCGANDGESIMAGESDEIWNHFIKELIKLFNLKS